MLLPVRLAAAAAFSALFAVALPVAARAAVPIVAAENFYGDIARQIGGADVSVHSILSNPDQDPHMFEASPSVGRALSGARIVILNGADYDPWMEKLLGAAKGQDRAVITVADLVGRKSGDNPHIWYDVGTMRALARALTEALGKADPPHEAAYTQRLAAFEASLAPIDAKVAALRERLAGTPVTATEPVFGYVFAALGMDVRDEKFQIAVMNDTEPSASDVAAIEKDIRTRTVKLLVYNSQATDEIAKRMEKLARAAHLPVVGATETEPPGKDYQHWILDELAAVDRALPQRPQ
jgi:zinc/manganese transport system substrate-binding protein